MPALVLEKRIMLPGFIGVWDWKEEDWKVPLKFPIANGNTYLLFESFNMRREKRSKNDFVTNGYFGLQFDEPSKALLKAVTTKSPRSTRLAEEMFSLYEDTMRRFESVLRTRAGLKELFWSQHETFSRFFGDEYQPVRWAHGADQGNFRPKLKSDSRRLSSPYLRRNLIDRSTFAKLQHAITHDDPISDAVYELFRIRSRVAMRDRALPLIEAAIVTERTIREFVLWKLAAQGLSRNRVKELKNDLTFGLNSNVFLPLCLTKSEMTRMKKHIDGVNKLRKLRNDIAHSNIGYDDVTYDDAKDSVEAAIALVKFVEKKLPN